MDRMKRTSRSVVSVALIGFFVGSSAHAQPSEQNCRYRDKNGNCRANPIFTKKRPPPPQKLIIESEPRRATVLLDGVEQNRETPLTLTGLTPGEHTLVVQRANHEPSEQTIYVKPNGTQRISVRLDSWPKLNIKLKNHEPDNDAPAKLFIDGEARGELPLTEDVDIFVAPGPHVVTITRKGFVRYDHHLKLDVNKTAPLQVTLDKATGTLALETNLDGLPVLLVPRDRCRTPVGEKSERGRNLGTTPLAEVVLRPGTYCIEYQIPGADAHRRTVGVVQGERALYSFQFPIPPVEKQEFSRLWGQWQADRVWRRCTSERPDVTDRSHGDQAKDCFVLGVTYQLDGRDDEQYTKAQKMELDRKAMRLFKRACDLGMAQGCEAYGLMLYAGAGGLEADRPGARERFKQGCNPELPRACYRAYLRHEDSKLPEPADMYELNPPRDIADHDSLVYEPWLSARVSTWTDLDDGVVLGSFDFDIPLLVFPYVGEYFGGNNWSVTLGYRFGGGYRFDGDDLPGSNGQDPDSGGTVGVASGVGKVKTVWLRRFYADVELDTEGRFGVAVGSRIPWLDHVVIKAGALYTPSDHYQAFISVGFATGWLLR